MRGGTPNIYQGGLSTFSATGAALNGSGSVNGVYARLRETGGGSRRPHKLSAPSNSITARFTNTLIIGRSSRCWRKTLNTPASPAASRRSSKRCPSLVHTNRIADGRRFHRPCPAHRARQGDFATRTAALIIPAVGNNYLRHEKLQRFMLANDSVTVAVEVPIRLTRADITALERHHGIRLLPEGAPADQTITGHIDFLQVRNGAVHILDYIKPDARTNRPFAQFTIYALALTRLAGLRLFDIKCAWFNEDQYCEFFPRTVPPVRIEIAAKDQSASKGAAAWNVPDPDGQF